MLGHISPHQSRIVSPELLKCSIGVGEASCLRECLVMAPIFAQLNGCPALNTSSALTHIGPVHGITIFRIEVFTDA